MDVLYVLGLFLCGYGTNFILPLLGIYHGKKGVDYYAEVHTRRQNILAHVAGMPVTIFGMTLWIPAIGEWAYQLDPHLTQYCLFSYYLDLYSYIKLG